MFIFSPIIITFTLNILKMKKTILLSLISLMIYSCGGNQESSNEIDSKKKEEIDVKELSTRLNNEGIELYNKGEYEKSIKKYSESLEIKKSKEVLLNRANAFTAINKYDEAENDYMEIIHVDNSYWKAYYERSRLKYKFGKFADALTDLDKTLELNPEFGEGYFAKGWVVFELKDTNTACESWKKASSLGFKKANDPIAKNCK